MSITAQDQEQIEVFHFYINCHTESLIHRLKSKGFLTSAIHEAIMRDEKINSLRQELYNFIKIAEAKD